MKTEVHRRFETIENEWAELSQSNPMQSLSWSRHWWDHYATESDLLIISIRTGEGKSIGLVPWMVSKNRWSQRVISFIGQGEVCSDHLSVLVVPNYQNSVCAAVADELHSGLLRGAWDEIHLESCDSNDSALREFQQQMHQRGAISYDRPATASWQIQLPDTWDEYLATLSKSHRKRCRRLYAKYFESGIAELHSAVTSDELRQGMTILRDLHQARWDRDDQPGVFQGQFLAYHNDVMASFHEQGRLRLRWLSIQGEPASAEYQFTDNNTVYAYQAGMNPLLLQHQPGNLSLIASIKIAIEDGYRCFDFLRGDEPYKAHWRAERCPAVETRYWPGDLSGQLVASGWKLRDSLKSVAKRGVATTSACP